MQMRLLVTSQVAGGLRYEHLERQGLALSTVTPLLLSPSHLRDPAERKQMDIFIVHGIRVVVTEFGVCSFITSAITGRFPTTKRYIIRIISLQTVNSYHLVHQIHRTDL